MNTVMAAPSQHVLGIDPKMYRHFTALTLVISFTVAFFANGEQERALQNVARSKVARQDKKAHTLLSGSELIHGVSGDPSPVRMGKTPPPPQPVTNEGALDPVGFEDGQSPSKANRFAYRRPRSVLDPAMLAGMTQQQRATYLRVRELQDQQPVQAAGSQGASMSAPVGNQPGAPSQQQINHLVAASRVRSGGSD